MASTELRAAAQQALEALHSVEWHGGSSAWMLNDCKVEGAIHALRAALVEDAMQKFTDVNQELEAALAEPTGKEGLQVEPVHEPDLSRCPNCNGPADNGHDRSIPPSPYWCKRCMAEPVGCEHCNQPLYAAVKCRVCGRVTEPVQEPVAWMHVPYPGNGMSPLVSRSEQREPSMYAASVPLYLKEQL